MKRAFVFIPLMVLTIIFTISATAQKSDFSGTWKIDRTKSVLPEYTPILTKITVNLKTDSLVTKRFYDVGDGQEYPFDEKLPLNGTNVSITIYDMPRKANVTWSDKDNTVNLTSTITYYDSGSPVDFNSKETWKVDQANTLTISFVNKSSQGESAGQFFFTKASQ
jgi:hypothetical protein